MSYQVEYEKYLSDLQRVLGIESSLSYSDWLLRMHEVSGDNKYFREFIGFKVPKVNVIENNIVDVQEHIMFRTPLPPEGIVAGEEGDVNVGRSIYELTLTIDKDDPYLLRDVLKRVVNSDMYEVKNWKACIELTKAGMPHIHAVLWSDRKYCDGTKIKKFYPYRYEFKRVRDVRGYLNYIKKESGNVSIQEYCNRKGIPQFWDASQI